MQTAYRSEQKEWQSALILRDDDEDGVPRNRTMVDLERGTAVVRVPRGGQQDLRDAGHI
ncbi:DUF6191 domain-containing protein [Streptomyces sp. NPDC055134]